MDDRWQPCVVHILYFFRMINCLIDNLDDERMTDECEERLLEIQYFVVRDFR